MLFFLPVTGYKFPATRNILSFTGKNPFVTDTHFVTGGILPVTGSFSCDNCIFHHVIGNVPPITRCTVVRAVTLNVLNEEEEG